MQPFTRALHLPLPVNPLGWLNGVSPRVTPPAALLPPGDQQVPALEVSHDLQQLLGLRIGDRPHHTAGSQRDTQAAETDRPAVDSRAAARVRVPRAPNVSSDTRTEPLSLDRVHPSDPRPFAEALVAQYTALWHWGPIAQLPNREAVMVERAAAVARELGRRGVPTATIERVTAGFDAMRKAADLVERRMLRVQARLNRPDATLRHKLQASGVDGERVHGGLYRVVNDMLQTLSRWASQGEEVFTRVPGTAALLDMAIRATEEMEGSALAPHTAGTVRAVVSTTATATAPLAITTAPGASSAAAASASPAPDAPREDSTEPAASALSAPSTAATTGATRADAPAPVGEQARALQTLRAFEATWRTRLWQYAGGTLEDAGRLSMGLVDFQDLDTLAWTFPCALKVRQVPSREPLTMLTSGAVRYTDVPEYPDGEAPFSTVRRATHDDREVIVRRDPATGRVSVGAQRMPAQPTGIYTDDTVEAAKHAMWTRIFREAFTRSIPQ